MEKSSGMSKMAGRTGSLFVAVGVLLFFLGIFGAPRWLAFAGLAFMVASVICFSVEEFGPKG